MILGPIGNARSDQDRALNRSNKRETHQANNFSVASPMREANFKESKKVGHDSNYSWAHHHHNFNSSTIRLSLTSPHHHCNFNSSTSYENLSGWKLLGGTGKNSDPADYSINLAPDISMEDIVARLMEFQLPPAKRNFDKMKTRLVGHLKKNHPIHDQVQKLENPQLKK